MNTFNKNIILPSTLSIITTYRCSSACENCCFQCNPLRKEMFSIDEIKKYIKQLLCGVAAVCVFYVAVAVVSVAAVAYTAAAGVTAIASLGVYTSIKAYGRSSSIQRILDDNSVLKYGV